MATCCRPCRFQTPCTRGVEPDRKRTQRRYHPVCHAQGRQRLSCFRLRLVLRWWCAGCHLHSKVSSPGFGSRAFRKHWIPGGLGCERMTIFARRVKEHRCPHPWQVSEFSTFQHCSRGLWRQHFLVTSGRMSLRLSTRRGPTRPAVTGRQKTGSICGGRRLDATSALRHSTSGPRRELNCCVRSQRRRMFLSKTSVPERSNAGGLVPMSCTR